MLIDSFNFLNKTVTSLRAGPRLPHLCNLSAMHKVNNKSDLSMAVAVGSMHIFLKYVCNCLQNPFTSHPRGAVTLFIITSNTPSRNDELLKNTSKYNPYLNITLDINEPPLLIQKKLVSLGSDHCELWSEYGKYGLLVDRELCLNKMLN